MPKKSSSQFESIHEFLSFSKENYKVILLTILFFLIYTMGFIKIHKPTYTQRYNFEPTEFYLSTEAAYLNSLLDAARIDEKKILKIAKKKMHSLLNYQNFKNFLPEYISEENFIDFIEYKSDATSGRLIIHFNEWENSRDIDSFSKSVSELLSTEITKIFVPIMKRVIVRDRKKLTNLKEIKETIILTDIPLEEAYFKEAEAIISSPSFNLFSIYPIRLNSISSERSILRYGSLAIILGFLMGVLIAYLIKALKPIERGSNK